MPPRLPISDAVEGVVMRLDDDFLLSAAMLTRGEFVAAGALIIRYGIPYLDKPYSVAPDLVVLDYGDMLTGEAAWEFLIKQSHLHPRADVLGHRDDGSDQMLAVKQLDFAIPFDVFVYHQTADRKPLAKLDALIAAKPAAFPKRLLDYLPAFVTVADWQARHG